MSKPKNGRTSYTSKGIIGTNKKISNAVRAETPMIVKEIRKMDAFLKGKTVYFTIPNPNPNETNRKHIRVPGKELFGDWRTFKQYGKAGKPNNAKN